MILVIGPYARVTSPPPPRHTANRAFDAKRVGRVGHFNLKFQVDTLDQVIDSVGDTKLSVRISLVHSAL